MARPIDQRACTATDQETLRRACAGDRSAMRMLVECYRVPLYSFIYRMVRSAPVAEELVQETFVRVMRASARYKPSARVSTWLYRIASRLAMNEVARVRHTLESPLDGLHAGEVAEIVSSVDPLHAVQGREVQRLIEAALDRLPENQRAAVLLARVEEMSYAEIAEVLEISEGAVDGLLQRARQNLVKLLGPTLR